MKICRFTETVDFTEFLCFCIKIAQIQLGQMVGESKTPHPGQNLRESQHQLDDKPAVFNHGTEHAI